MLFNIPRAKSFLTQYGLDAMIATSPVNITYFTDYACWIDPLMKEYMMVPGASSNLGQGYAVFPRKGLSMSGKPICSAAARAAAMESTLICVGTGRRRSARRRLLSRRSLQIFCAATDVELVSDE